MCGFSRLVHQTSPSGRGGRSATGMRTTSSRLKMGTVELVGWTIRPRATSERISLMVWTGWVRRIGRPDGCAGGRAGRRPPAGWWGEQGDLLVGQILDGHRVLAGQAVRGGDGERPLVVGEDGARGEVRFVDSQPVAQDVDVAPAQRPVGIEGHDLLEPDLAGGIASLESRREPAERRAFGGEDASRRCSCSPAALPSGQLASQRH
jgi:hypothetical protein